MASKSERKSGLKTAATPGAVRPRFRERQVLRAADLEAQQSYLIAARRRHNIGQHGWGIVRGLEILDTPEFVVQPGVAVDGYGRELIVPSPVTIPNTAFNELRDVAVDVWLVYQLTAANVSQRGSWSCGPGKNTRSRAQVTLRLTPAAQTSDRLPIDVPRSPAEIPSADLPFLPHKTPPDDPAMEWPIYLGTIKRQTLPVYDRNSPRPFATLNGELVIAPSGVARVQVGSELQSDTRRFAVTLANASGKLIERLGIDRDGNTFINGNTTVRNSVNNPNTSRLHARLGPARLLNFKPLSATPAAAAPWQVYRTSVKQNGQTIQQLRFEIAHPGDKGDPKVSRLAIGTRNNAGAFAACFTVSADCTLTIEGDVTVHGQLVEGPIQPDATDPRFATLLATNWVEGRRVGSEIGRPPVGTIQGTVVDTTNAVIPAVVVELTNKNAAFSRRVTTDASGRFNAPQIPAGTYSIRVDLPGVTPQTHILAANQTLNIRFEIQNTTPIPG